MADLFSSTVVVKSEFEGEVVAEQPLPNADCCFDIYYPAETSTPPPVVLIVIGFPDFGRKQENGKGLKDLPPYISWGKLLASNGMATVIASCSDPAANLLALTKHLSAKQQDLPLDMQRLAIWTCSGNGPTAIDLLAKLPAVKAGVFLYSFMADLGSHDVVARTAEQFRFCNPEGNRDRILDATPLFIVRAGQDEFSGLNETLDRYVGALKGKNPDVEFINYEQGVHGFDLVDSSAESKQIINRLLDYLRDKLCQPQAASKKLR